MQYIQNIKAMNDAFIEQYAANNSADIISFPRFVTITTTLKCNYRCAMCYQQRYDQEIDVSHVRKIEPFLPFAKKLQIFGGEPFLYHGIEDIIKLAHKYECDIFTITNGSLLNDAMIDMIVDNRFAHIKCSLDAGTPKTYKAIRGGDFFKVVNNIARLSLKKARLRIQYPDIQFNFLAMKNNIHELAKLAVIAAEIGVYHINVFFPQCLTEAVARNCLYFWPDYSDEHMTRAVEIGAALGVHVSIPPLFAAGARAVNHVRFEDVCKDPWSTLLVNVDGSMQLCCGGPTGIGNLATDDIGQAWHSMAATALRRTVNTDRQPAYCSRCLVRKPAPRDLAMHIPDKALADKIMARMVVAA